MGMPIEGLNRPVPDQSQVRLDQKINSPLSERYRLDNGTKLLPVSQEGRILRGRNRWGLVLPLAGILGTATALAADPVADYLSLLQSLDNSHQTSYSPPQRDVNKYLGIKTARGDSGAPAVYRNYLPFINNRAPELRSTAQSIDPEAITPEECRTLTADPWAGVVITEAVTIRLIGAVVAFPDQQQALNTARTSTYYHDLLYRRLTLAVEFINRHLPFKFEIEMHQEPLVTPKAFSEIEEGLSHAVGSSEYLEYYRQNNGLPIRRYPEYYQIIRRGGYQDTEYPIYALMYAPDPIVSLQELYRKGHASAGFGRIFTRSPQGGALAGMAIFPWYSANPESRENQRSTTEHEILHAIGILEHDPVNQNSVMFKSSPNRDRAILTRANVAGLCSP